MLFAMACVAVSSIVLYVGGAIVATMLLTGPTKYVIMALCVITALAHAFWLYHVIGELYAEMPKKRPRKRKTQNNTGHRLMALVTLEILSTVAVYILYTNGVKIPAPGIVTIIILAGLISLLF